MGDRWATFDCYGTLIDWNRGIESALGEILGHADSGRLLAHYHAVEPRVQAESSLPYREVMGRSAAAVAAIEGVELEDGREHALAESLPSWRPFAEVPEALGELRRRGWRLAILSNTDPDLLAASVEALGVSFDLLITAEEAGSYKPAPGHWRRFRDQVGGELDAHAHVAASLFHDVAPCAELRIPCVWINRLGESSDLPRAAELSDLAGLPDTLDRVAPA
jgi:2-haloacid dehalogenase